MTSRCGNRHLVLAAQWVLAVSLVPDRSWRTLGHRVVFDEVGVAKGEGLAGVLVRAEQLAPEHGKGGCLMSGGNPGSAEGGDDFCAMNVSNSEKMGN